MTFLRVRALTILAVLSLGMTCADQPGTPDYCQELQRTCDGETLACCEQAMFCAEFQECVALFRDKCAETSADWISPPCRPDLGR